SLLVDEGFDPPADLWSPAGRGWLAAQSLPANSRAIVERQLLRLDLTEALKEAQKETLAARALASPTAQRLMQLVGLGIDLAVMWVGEVGDPHRFPSAKQLVSYAGLNPRVYQSGETRRGGRITKAGRSQLRWIMVEAAHRHVANDGPEAEWYHAQIKR